MGRHGGYILEASGHGPGPGRGLSPKAPLKAAVLPVPSRSTLLPLSLLACVSSPDNPHGEALVVRSQGEGREDALWPEIQHAFDLLSNTQDAESSAGKRGSKPGFSSFLKTWFLEVGPTSQPQLGL